MENKQNGVTVIILRNGVRIEVEEDTSAVFAKYNEADDADNDEFKRWILSDYDEKFPRPRNKFKVTERGTGNEISLYAKQVSKIIVKEVEKPEEVVRDQDDELTTSEAGSSRVTLVDGTELEVEEDFDTVNAHWNAALRGENGTPVMSLTEKDSGWGLSVLAENIELVEEMR